MIVGEAIVLSTFIFCVCFIFFMLFGGFHVILWMHSARQYRKLLASWYQRTNPDDPMPVMNGRDDAEDDA